jgi:hypothetical protein
MMYDLLVRLVDSDELSKGSVIAAKKSDEAWWTKAEKANPNWRIIQVDVTEQVLFSMLSLKPAQQIAMGFSQENKRAITLNIKEIGNRKHLDKEALKRCLEVN